MIQPDKIIRSARKTLSISVDAYGRLTVRAPRHFAKERIFAFLQEKEAWILRKQAQMHRVGMRLPPENLDGYVFSLLGRQTKITLVDGWGIRLEGEDLYLPKENARERLVKWLKENAKRIFTKEAEVWSSRMGVECASLAVGSARGRWGSCSAENDLRFTFRLLYCPKEIIEYVVVHELAHIRHKNHSPRFWREVERYIPDWKERRQWLKERGIFMQIF